jgi:hypothetical protein
MPPGFGSTGGVFFQKFWVEWIYLVSGPATVNVTEGEAVDGPLFVEMLSVTAAIENVNKVVFSARVVGLANICEEESWKGFDAL